jgi:hypothetical protein
MPDFRVSRLPHRFLLLGALLGAGVLGCGADGATGVGGILVVTSVEIEAGPGSVLVGGTLPLTATPRTSSGIPVPGKSVTWSSSATSTATVSQSGLVRGISEGSATIRAEVEGIAGQVSIDVHLVPVASVQVELGATQLPAGQTTTAQAFAFDADGAPLQARPATWSTSDGTVATVSTSGLVTTVRDGTVNVIATVEGRTGAAPLTVLPRVATQLGFVVPPSAAVAGTPIAPPIQVAFQDAAGATATTATGVITLALAPNAVGAVLSGTLSAAAVAGVATFSNVRINRSGPGFQILASAPGMAAANSPTLTVSSAPPAELAIVTAPSSSAVTGAPLAIQPLIEVRDSFGNPVAQPGEAVTATIATGSGALSGTATVLTDATGRARFTDLAITGPVGSYTLRFQAWGLVAVTSAPIVLGAGGATQLSFTTAPPASAVNGLPMAGTVRVQLRDASGNPVGPAGVTVTASLESGTGVLSGSLSALTGSTGEAAFSNLIVTGVVGTVTLQFSTSGVAPVISAPIALTAGAEQALTFVTTPPTTAVNGVVLTATPVVQLRDVSGNPVLKAGVSVTVTAQSTVAGVLQGTLTQTTNAQGQASFPGLSILGTVGAYTLAFQSGSLTAAVANPLQLSAGAATAMALATPPPGSAQSGAPLSPQPVVQIVDQSGNPAGQGHQGLLVTVAVSAGASVSNESATTDAGGLATFSGLTLSGPTGSYTLTFQSASLPDLAGGTISLGGPPASQMVFITTPPVQAINGELFSPQPLVDLRDASNNPVPVAGVGITASLLSGPGILGGTVTVQTNGVGRATFTDLVLQGAPGVYVIRFASPGLPNLDSGNITLLVGPATQLVFQAAPPAGATSGQPFTSSTVIALADVTGNLVATTGTSITAQAASGPGAVLGGTTTRQTLNGLATFDDLMLTGPAGSYTLDFTSGSLTKATSNAITLSSATGPASQLVFVTAPPASGTSGVALSPAPVLQLRDSGNNDVAQAGVTVDASIISGGSGGATLGGASAQTDANGQATFASLSITGPADNYTLAFTFLAPGGLTGVIQPTPTAISPPAPATPTQLALVTAPSATVQNAEPLAQQPTVQLLDASSTPVAQAGVAITVGINAGGGSLGGGQLTVNTDPSGQAAFSGLTITGTVGVRTLSFSGTGLTSLVSGSIDVTPGNPAGLAMVNQPPATATSGAPLASAPSVSLVDVSGNSVATAGTTVNVAVTGGATLGGTLSQATDPSGLATFPGLSLTGPAGSYHLDFTTGLASISSSAIALSVPPPAAGLDIAIAPSGAVPNDVVFPQQPAIQLVDGANGPVATAGVPVTAAIKSGQGALLGTLTVDTDAAGLATFTDLRIQGLVGSRTIEFTSGVLTPVETGTISVSAGTATSLDLVQDVPASVAVQEVFSPAPSVRLLDISGNLVDSTGVMILVSLSPAGATLGGATTQATVVGGSAAFPDLSLNGAAGTYTLTFSGTGLNPVPSSGVTLIAPANLTITVQPSANADNDVPFSQQPVVQVTDGSGTAMVGVSVTATLIRLTGPTSVVLVGTATQVTGAGGSASWTDLKIVKTGTSSGTYQLVFSTVNGLSVASSNIQIP